MANTMRKLLTFLIALAAATPAYADTVKSTFDFGPAFPERLAMVMFTCKACHGAKSVSINGVQLELDVTSGGEEVAEIWSALLPDGSGELPVLITSDHSLLDADVGVGAAKTLPTRKIGGRAVKRTAAGSPAYSFDAEDGDVRVATVTDSICGYPAYVIAQYLANGAASCYIDTYPLPRISSGDGSRLRKSNEAGIAIAV
jgi:hypothetical protein